MELWRSVSGKLHLPGENDRARCGLSSSQWEKTTGILSDVTCLRCKNTVDETFVEEHSPEPETPKELAWKPVFRFEANEEGPRLCWCGCGRPVGSKKARFIPGHDARLYAVIRKIEEGEVDEGIIPEELRQRMSHCRCCGKLILPHESGMGPLCRTGRCSCKK